MIYKVGDTIIHWTHGLGTVIAVEEMELAGTKKWYYVIEVDLLKLWVPIEEASKGAIRFPMEPVQLKDLLEILREPGRPLPDHYFQRKMALRERMQKRTLEELCHVIRDLKDRSAHHPLNADDSSILFSAEEYLLDEWVISIGTERSTAQRELESMLVC